MKSADVVSGDSRYSAASAGTAPETVDWLGIAITALEFRRLIILLPLVSLVAALAVTLVTPRTYTTTLSFTPSQASVGSGLAGLAGLVGVSLPGAEPSASPYFYEELLDTRHISERIVSTPIISDSTSRNAGTLADLYDIDGGSPNETTAEAIRLLRTDLMIVEVNRQTSVISVHLRTKWPDVSYQLGALTLQLVDEFNLASRQSQASAEQRFLEQRLDTVRSELRQSETDLERFLATNRSFQNDPRLLFEHDRLQRALALRQNVFELLTQSHEQARMAAVRNTPSVSIVEPPKRPLQPDPRNWLTTAIGALGIGVLLALLCVLVGGVARTVTSRDPTRAARLKLLWRESLRRIRVPHVRA